jgi:hypothetical protein
LAGWLAELEESEAELRQGLIVPGDEVMRELHESVARLEGEQAALPKQRPATRR